MESVDTVVFGVVVVDLVVVVVVDLVVVDAVDLEVVVDGSVTEWLATDKIRSDGLLCPVEECWSAIAERLKWEHYSIDLSSTVGNWAIFCLCKCGRILVQSFGHVEADLS